MNFEFTGKIFFPLVNALIIILDHKTFYFLLEKMNSEINLNTITTNLQQNNNWNVMTIENVLNNNKQHPVNTAVWHCRNASIKMVNMFVLH